MRKLERAVNTAADGVIDLARRIHWPGFLGALTTVFGILSRPEILALLPAKAATAVTIAGVVIQAVTKPVHKTEDRYTR